SATAPLVKRLAAVIPAPSMCARLASAVLRMCQCMSITGALQLGAGDQVFTASCACTGQAATAPRPAKSFRRSISSLRFRAPPNGKTHVAPQKRLFRTIGDNSAVHFIDGIGNKKPGRIRYTAAVKNRRANTREYGMSVWI